MDLCGAVAFRQRDNAPAHPDSLATAHVWDELGVLYQQQRTGRLRAAPRDRALAATGFHLTRVCLVGRLAVPSITFPLSAERACAAITTTSRGHPAAQCKTEGIGPLRAPQTGHCVESAG